jgi:hypothetical protein
MTTSERPITAIYGDSMAEAAWPSIVEIVKQFERACLLLADFVAFHDDVVANLDRRSPRSGDGPRLTIAQCRQWAVDRRELVEAIAIRFGALEPRGLGAPQVERVVTEALDIITSGTTAAQAVYLRDLLNG